jgi:hypothetical protein
MADGKYRKTYVAGSVDRENTVHIHTLNVPPCQRAVTAAIRNFLYQDDRTNKTFQKNGEF